jgi:AcrR family transcriptional regulator
MKSNSVSRKELEKAARSEFVLDAAESVFVSRGFAGASVEEIAARAEVSLATLYKTFPSKEALFGEVVGRRMVAFVEAAREAISGKSPSASLEALVHAAFRYFEKHDGAFRLYLSATRGLPWEFRANLREGSVERYRDFLGNVEKLVREAMSARNRKEARGIALAIVGALNAMLGEWIEQPQRRSASIVAGECWSVLRRLVEDR